MVDKISEEVWRRLNQLPDAKVEGDPLYQVILLFTDVCEEMQKENPGALYIALAELEALAKRRRSEHEE